MRKFCLFRRSYLVLFVAAFLLAILATLSCGPSAVVSPPPPTQPPPLPTATGPAVPPTEPTLSRPPDTTITIGGAMDETVRPLLGVNIWIWP